MTSISQYIADIETANGRAFIQSPLRPSVRAACELMAIAVGVPAESVGNVTDSDLCALYAVGRSTPAQIPTVAARISRKLGTGTNPLLDPTPAPLPGLPQAPAPADLCPECGRGRGKHWSDCSLGGGVGGMQPEPATRPGMGGAEPVDWHKVRQIADSAAFDAVQGVQADLSAALADMPALAAKAASDAVQALQPTNLIVTLPSAQPVALGTVHYATERLIKYIAAGVNVYLYGPAGSGKTTGARKVADAFKLPFYFSAKLEDEYGLLGFILPSTGKVVRTPFREAYEHGGLFLFDELDASNPAAVVALNAALANGICPFPDAMIERHPDFKCVAAGNTKLTGANRQYVGRAQLDAASIDRFAFIEWLYDEALEMALSPNKRWGQWVQAVRRAVEERAISHLVTPRATIDGCKLLEAGDTWEEAERAVLWKGLDADTVAQIKNAAHIAGSN